MSSASTNPRVGKKIPAQAKPAWTGHPAPNTFLSPPNSNSPNKPQNETQNKPRDQTSRTKLTTNLANKRRERNSELANKVREQTSRRKLRSAHLHLHSFVTEISPFPGNPSPRALVLTCMIPTEPKGLCISCNRAVDLDADVCPYCNALLDYSASRPPGSERHDPLD
jgi:hypothetical protein